MILRMGNEGQAVTDLQRQLVAIGQMSPGQITGFFDGVTEGAVFAFQRAAGIGVDGLVGPQTRNALAVRVKAVMAETAPVEPKLPQPTNDDYKPLSSAERARLFGTFQYRTRNNGEIDIIDDWEEKNIAKVFIPELVGIDFCGKPSTGYIRWNQKCANQIHGLFKDWAALGLINRILTFDGAFYPRMIRGSSTSLSNHSWGTAFDINAEWNGLGQRGAMMGEKGCLIELVPMAKKWGFYWGGDFTRKDKMHFEIRKLYP